MMDTLEIKDLHVSVEDKEILKGLNLTIQKGEKVALLGPNGHGKSTLLNAIMGNPRYKVTSGSILLNGEDVLSMKVDERSRKGLFLAFQNPVEIPGVISADFYKNALQEHSEKRISLYQFYKVLDNVSKEVKIPFEMFNRALNDGFSGGEKKRNEILQMMLLNPKIAMLDEIDSGLDVDAINTVSVVLEGGPEVYKRIDKEGYERIKEELNISLENENEKAMNQVSIGVCATKEIIKNGK